MKNVILVQYGEIALKGKNRIWFEMKLVDNIRFAISRQEVRVKRLFGRILIEPTHSEDFNNHKEICSALKRIFGIVHFSFATQVKAEYSAIERAVLQLLSDYPYTTFAIRTHRSDKQFSMNSVEVNTKLGAAVQHRYGGTVQLTNPDVEVQVLITDTGSFISFKKIQGAGGLPVGVSGTVISLLSAGIDSPVASYRMMKRGASILYLHFHSYPVTSRASIENVQDIVQVLQKHQTRSTLILTPFADFQKKISTSTPPRLRILLYRRAMMQIAQELAGQYGARGIVTGESLGQVASQTLENIQVTSSGLSLPVFRPLIGMDKQEIIEEAESIGTYTISIRPYEDCCSLLLPKKVETHATVAEVAEVEKNLPWKDMLSEVIEQCEYKPV